MSLFHSTSAAYPEQGLKEPLLELALQFVNSTNTHLFLTGRAGTGKTTFLRSLGRLSPKRHVILAPTGVAAINAGGQTLHSFFQLPFGPIVPGSVFKRKDNEQRNSATLQLRKSKIDLIRSLDLVVIDEISMVRADLLDAVDEVLRHYRKNNRPFGGLQLLMIGDLLQLPPVVKNEEWDLLRDHYDNLFFYSSKALKQSNFVTITLETVFRQTDEHFIALLNAVRSGNPDASVLEELNSRFHNDTKAFEDQGYITLTTHNRTADDINHDRLAAIDKPVFRSKATIRGDFPEHLYPTHETLELKTGAQVMFVKNDPGPEKRYYNGLIGTIVDIDEDGQRVEVACDGMDETISVGPIEWQNTVYELDSQTKDITEKVIGSFAQLPLRLAWAVTIHKSQGLTFDKVIIDAAAAFDHGQVYVALSRCRTLEGLVFKSRIPRHAIKTHQNLTAWLDGQKDIQPDQQLLAVHRKDFIKQLLTELFDFGTLKNRCDYLLRQSQRNQTSLQPGFTERLAEANNTIENQLDAISKKFEPQLLTLIEKASLSAEDEQALLQRLVQASGYYLQIAGKLNELLNIAPETDDKTLGKSLTELLKELTQVMDVKKACFEQLAGGFRLEDFLRARALAGIEDKEKNDQYQGKRQATEEGLQAKGLKSALLSWRNKEARNQGVEPSRIIPMSAVFEIVANPPLNLKELQKVKGIGKKRLEQYGPAIIALVDGCLGREPQKTDKKGPRKASHEITLEVYENNPGIGLKELALLRGLAESTVAGHLCHAIEQGKVDVADLVEEAKINLIEEYFASVDDDRLGPAKDILGQEVSFDELKLVKAALRFRGFQNSTGDSKASEGG